MATILTDNPIEFCYGYNTYRQSQWALLWPPHPSCHYGGPRSASLPASSLTVSLPMLHKHAAGSIKEKLLIFNNSCLYWLMSWFIYFILICFFVEMIETPCTDHGFFIQCLIYPDSIYMYLQSVLYLLFAYWKYTVTLYMMLIILVLNNECLRS